MSAALTGPTTPANAPVFSFSPLHLSQITPHCISGMCARWKVHGCTARWIRLKVKLWQWVLRHLFHPFSCQNPFRIKLLYSRNINNNKKYLPIYLSATSSYLVQIISRQVITPVKLVMWQHVLQIICKKNGNMLISHARLQKIIISCQQVISCK